MNVDYTVAALMFPAIPLIMTVYSNRFHTLSALIRKLHDEYVFKKQIPPEWEKQLHNLNGRTNLLKYTMGFASFGFASFAFVSFAIAGAVASVCAKHVFAIGCLSFLRKNI